MLFKLKEMKRNVKQKAVKRQGSNGNVFLSMYVFNYMNKLWTIVYRKQNVNLSGEIYEKLLHTVDYMS